MKKTLLIQSAAGTQDLLNEKFNLIYEFNCRYDNNISEQIFDALLIIDVLDDSKSSEILDLCKLTNIPVIGHKRYAKNLQHLILKKLNINTPDTFFDKLYPKSSNFLTDFKIVSLLDKLDYEDKIILKMNNGARGLGQMMCTKKELYRFALDGFPYEKLTECTTNNTDSKYFDSKKQSSYSNLKKAYTNKSYSGDVDAGYDDTVYKEKTCYTKTDNTTNESYDIKVNGLTHVKDSMYNDCIIQCYINVKEEYRYLYFYGESPIIIKRKKTDNNWQANSCITGFGEIISLNENKNIFNFIPKIEELCNYLNVPFLSIDLYIDKNDNVGIFEFQMEFGIQKVPHSELIRKICDSVNNKINDYIKI